MSKVLTKREQGWLHMAKVLALSADEFGSARVAAVLVHKNTLIACGTNGSKKSPIALKHTQNKEKIYPHAEVGVLYRASKLLDFSDFRRCVLYVVRVNKAGQLAIAKPCQDCQSAINSFGVRRVIHSVADEVAMDETLQAYKITKVTGQP